MRTLNNLMLRAATLLRDRKGQDLVEFALLCGFVAVAAGAIMPFVSTSISTIFSKVASVVNLANCGSSACS